jgi:hypothetical protein
MPGNSVDSEDTEGDAHAVISGSGEKLGVSVVTDAVVIVHDEAADSVSGFEFSEKCHRSIGNV